MKLDHIGVALRVLSEAADFYRQALNLEVVHREEVPGQGVRVAFLVDPKDPEGCQVELLEPIAGAGAVAKFLSERGPGLHHLAFRAPSVGAAMKKLRQGGKPPLEEAPRPGARGHQVCFLHPKLCHGVLVELVGQP